jgi:hypothetical protein
MLYLSIRPINGLEKGMLDRKILGYLGGKEWGRNEYDIKSNSTPQNAIA